MSQIMLLSVYLGNNTLKAYVPQGIESVNGSSPNMTCSHGDNCLLDGHSPYLDTSQVNWASDLVTVRKNNATDDIEYDHVVLTFFFERCVKMVAVEVDFFLCPQWGIHSPYLTLYGSNTAVYRNYPPRSGYAEQTYYNDFISNYEPIVCGYQSLSKVRIPVERGEKMHSFWHIIVSFPPPYQDIEWVHVEEVRFVLKTHLRDTDDVDDDDEQPTTDCLPNPDPAIEDSVVLTTNVLTSTVHIITNDLSSPKKISSNYIPVPDSTNNETLPSISQTGVGRPQFTTTVTTSILPTAVPPGLESSTRTSVLATTTSLSNTTSVLPTTTMPLDDTSSVQPTTTSLNDTNSVQPTTTTLDDTSSAQAAQPTTTTPLDDTSSAQAAQPTTTTSLDNTISVLPTTTSLDNTTTLLGNTTSILPTTTLSYDTAPGPVLPTTTSPDDTTLMPEGTTTLSTILDSESDDFIGTSTSYTQATQYLSNSANDNDVMPTTDTKSEDHAPYSTSHIIIPPPDVGQPGIDVGSPDGNDDQQTRKNDFFLLFIIIIIATLVGLCLLILIALLIMGVHLRQRMRVKLQKTVPTNGHQVTFSNPLYISPSIITEND